MSDNNFLIHNSMLTKRIIPCLDIKDGRTVKGVNFEGLRDAGDPVELARRYSEEGADELVFLDITATKEKRKTLVDLVRKISRQINIPFTVGGGITSVDEISAILKAGADKVSLNSSIVRNPSLVTEASDHFGSQAIVAAVDAKKRSGHHSSGHHSTDSAGQNLTGVDTAGQHGTGQQTAGQYHTEQHGTGRYEVFVRGGSVATGLDAIDWIRRVEELGAGEILLTSMDRDGTKEGFDLELLRNVSDYAGIPVIASGGAGTIRHCIEALVEGRADAVLAASIFHFREIAISDLKREMIRQQIPVRYPAG
ncbi:MAG: imidazole glycerol phosphate synthase subunit HisF [Balneolaceae bacterium]